MINHKRNSLENQIKFSLIVTLTLFIVFSGNALTVTTSRMNVLSTAKDTVINDKKIVQTPIDSTARAVKPIFNQPNKDSIYMKVDKMPKFPGGIEELNSYIGHNMKYPVKSFEKGIQGKIIVKFVVSKSGKVENVQILRGLDPYLDKEGIRVIKSLPDFIPGELKGEKVPVYIVMPLTFKID